MSELTTVRHNVGTCPACRDYLWADVDLTVILGTPTLDGEGKPNVSAVEAPESDSEGFQHVSGHPDGSQALQSASSVQPMPDPYRSAQPCGPCRLGDHEDCGGHCPCGDEHEEPK